MVGSILFKNISYIVSLDDNDTLYRDVDLLVEGNLIKRIGNLGDVEADRVIDCRDLVMYPGLVNAHHHFYQIFSRNIREVQNLELFDWLRYLYEIWKNLDEEVVYYSSLLSMAELLKSGCTTTVDHHYVFPKGQNYLIDRQFDAADRMKIRFYATRGSMDLSKKDGGLPPDSVVQSIDEIAKDSIRLIDKYNDPSPFSMHRVALAPCSPFSVSEDLLRESQALGREYKVRLHTHLGETKDEERYTLERFNKRPLEYMESLGWVGDDVWFAHGVHFSDEELRILKETHTGVCHCPISNMKLSSGIMRLSDMLKLNIKVGLGVDGSASNDSSNLLEEIRVAYLLHRLSSSSDAPSAYDILKIATRGSSSLLGYDSLGSIEEGKAADLFMISLSRIGTATAELDVKSLLGVVGYKGSVEYTVVNGEIRVDKGHLVDIDEDEFVSSARSSFKRYLSRANII